MVDIRQLDANDLEVWIKMRHALWPSASPKEHSKEVQELLSSDQFLAWAAWNGSDPVGFLELFVRPFANGCDNRPVPFLEGIWVDPSMRKSGVGRRLLESAESWAKSEGYSEVGSDALIDNLDSHKAHDRWGFVETEKVIYFKKKL